MTTPDLAGLCERLRAKRVSFIFSGRQDPIKVSQICNPDGPEAAAAIERLVAENERIREAGQKLFRAFNNPMVRRQLGGHDEQQMEAILSWREASARTALEGASDDR